MRVHTIVTSILLISALAVGAPASAAANDGQLSYTYLDGGYVNTDMDSPLNIDGDGARVEGSLAVTDRIFLLSKYTHQDLDFGTDLDQFEIGAGGHLPLAPGLDAVGTVSYLYTALDYGPADTDDGTIGLGLGLRGDLTDRFQLEGGVHYASVDVLSDDLMLSLGGRFYVTPQLALGGGVDAGDDMAMWNMGVRYEFR